MITRLVALFILLVADDSLASGKIKQDPFGEFQPYVDSFQVAGHSQGYRFKGQKFNIFLSDRMPVRDWVGVCYPGIRGQTPVILIKRSYWMRSDNLHREQVVWHEMGHCILRREHKEDEIKGHPVSIMYPDVSIVEDECYYLAHKKEYIKELFSLTNEM